MKDSKMNRTYYQMSIAFVVLVLGTTATQADGPIRRWIRGDRVASTHREVTRYRGVENQSIPTNTYCVDGSCTTSYVPSVMGTTLVTPNMAYSPVVMPTSELPTPVVISEVSLEGSESLHRSVVKAAVSANRKGELSRINLMKLRVAMLSPAFRSKVESLAIAQVVCSDEENIPFKIDESGNVIREVIDWEGLADFLEKILPLILQLLQFLG